MSDSEGIPSKRLKALKKNVITESGRFKEWAESNKNKAFICRIAVVILGAVTTFALGLKSIPLSGYEGADWERAMSIVALLCSAAIPVCAAWDAFCDYRSMWVQFTSTYTSLYSLWDDIDCLEMDRSQITEASVERLCGRYKAILGTTNNAWRIERLKKPEDGNDHD